MIMLIGMGAKYNEYLNSFRNDHKAYTVGIDISDLAGYYNIGMVYRIVHSYMTELKPASVIFVDLTDFPVGLLYNKIEGQKYIQILTEDMKPGWHSKLYDALCIDSQYDLQYKEQEVLTKVYLNINNNSIQDKTYKILSL